MKFRLEITLESSYQLPNLSFGFRSFCSTMDNLALLVSNIQESFCSKMYTSAVFIDIQGAYDNVNIHKLCHKILHLGVGPKTAGIIFDLLFGRQIYIRTNPLDNSLSRIVYTGLPQGSILSPLLFIIYTYDIFSVSYNSTLLQYADDLVIYSSSKDLDSSIINLDMSIFSLIEYLDNNNLTISNSKSSVCIFSKRKIPNWLNISLGNLDFPVVPSVRYLGLTLDNKLLWKDHITNLKIKCQKYSISR